MDGRDRQQGKESDDWRKGDKVERKKRDQKPRGPRTGKDRGKKKKKRPREDRGQAPREGSHEKSLWPPGNMLYPLPVVMASCGRPGEKPNIITVAWAGTVCSSPAMVSISVRKERYSYQIIKETGAFVINLVTKDLVFAADHCGVRSGRDEDKFKEMGLTPQPSRKVAPPGILESPVNIECKVDQTIPLGSHDMFIAQVLGVTVDERYQDAAGKFHLNDMGLVAYSHGAYRTLGGCVGTFGYSVKKSKKGR